MHHLESSRIIAALGDTNNTYSIYNRDGVWIIQDDTGSKPLKDWLGKIRMFDSVPSKELIEMEIKTKR